MNKLFTLSVSIWLITCINFSMAQSLKLDTTSSLWRPISGSVYCMVKDSVNNKIYMGGSLWAFVSPNSTPNGSVFDTVSINPLPSDAPNGVVRTVLSDDEGGWFIGGDFTAVGGKLRKGIAHINSDGTVSEKVGQVGFDARVTALLKMGDKLYVGGQFDTFGLSTSKYGIINRGYGFPTQIVPSVNGTVNAAVDDGNGGWYIGGSFTMFGDSVRNNLAHINANGKVTGWNPNANGIVRTIEFVNGRIFIGGSFTTIAGQARQAFAEVNTTSGAPTGLTMSASSTVYKLAFADGKLYVGGNFSTFAGQSRPNFAVVSLGSNSLLNPKLLNLNGYISMMKVVGDRIYIGGTFTSINSQTRNKLALIDTAANLQTWAPSWTPYGNVNALEYDQGRVFVSSDYDFFTTPSYSFVALDTITGSILFNFSQVVGSTKAMLFTDSVLFLSVTNYTLSNGVKKYGLIALNRTSLQPLDYNNILCDVSSPLNVIKSNGSTLFLGGDANAIGWRARKRLACIDLNTKLTNRWAPICSGASYLDNSVNSLLKSDSGIYIGGAFTTINSITRNRLAEVDTINGTLLSWNPNPNSTVYAIKEIENKLYVVGTFTSISGQTRSKVAMFSKGTRSLTNWIPNVSATVYDIDGIGSRIFIVGDFSSVNGSARSHFAELDTIGAGTLQSFYPFASPVTRSLNTIKVNASKLYVGLNGDLSNSFSGQSRQGVAIFDLLTNQLHPYTMNTYNGQVNAFGFNKGRVYVGGTYTNIGTLFRSGLAEFDCNTGMPTNWNFAINSDVYSMMLQNNKLWVVGGFTTVDGNSRGRAACYDIPSRTLLGWNPNANSPIKDIVVDKEKVFLGGQFTTVGGSSRNYLAAVDTFQGIATSWNPNANNFVNKLLMDDSTLYVAGTFTQLSGQARSYLASVNTNTGLLNAWNPFPNLEVNSLSKGNGVIYVGGDFSTIGGQGRNRLAAINSTTGLATSWNPPTITNRITSIIQYDSSTIIIGGLFTIVGSQTRSRIASLDAITGSLNPWKLSLNQPFNCFIQDGKKLYIAGSFSTINGDTVNRVAVLTDSCTFYKSNFSTSIFQVCQNDSITLVSNGMPGNSYKWYYNNSLLPNETSRTLYVKIAGNYQVVVNNNGCVDTSSVLTLTLKPRPTTSPITGNTNVLTNSVQQYSVINTSGSVYNWYVNLGQQTNGGNSNAVEVTWGNTNGFANLKVLERSSNGCIGDTVILTSINITPVKWLQFDGRYVSSKSSLLNWSTASEINNEKFIIERSEDGKLFKRIGEVKGSGNTNLVSDYEFIDTDCSNGLNLYYRLKQVDYNGHYDYSRVIYLKATTQDKSLKLSVYPNPANNKLGVFGIENPYDVYDVFGTCVIKSAIGNTLDISTLKQGVYFIIEGENKVKFIKY